MCSIVKLEGSLGDICDARDKMFAKDNDQILRLLNIKGGELFGVKIHSASYPDGIYTTIEDDDYESFVKKVNTYFRTESAISSEGHRRSDCVMIFHSRQAPEMESDVVLQQPYVINVSGEIVAVHGTIPRIETVEKAIGQKIHVDTDIFAKLPFKEACLWVEELGGKITAISINNEYSNGLGLYKFKIKSKYGNLKVTTNISPEWYDYHKFEYINVREVETPSLKVNKNKSYVILSTGGLDATMSTLHTLEHDPYGSYYHLYFDWGSNAAQSEIDAVKYLINTHYKDQYKETMLWDLKVFPIQEMFKNVLEVGGIKTLRLSDKDAVGGGHNEAEEAISYVPFRNTYLMTLAATWAEHNLPNQDVTFIIGANLSEGMIYLDNSTEWLEAMNKVVKVGGQKCREFSVLAPFATMTKTNMVKAMKPVLDRIGFDINNVFSCYFPKSDGVECGECGSCLLKKAAIEKGMK